VRKTSVYLPESLKDELHDLARRWQRSEAELLRLAVERLVRGAEEESAPASPARARPVGPALVGVGVGPSDPGLVTERAVRALRDADTVFAASIGPEAIGRAEAIVRGAAPEVRVERLVFAVAGTPEERTASVADAARALIERLDAGEVVVFVTLGDPNVFSTFPAVARAVVAERPSVPVTTVPGVMAFQELAAQSRTVLTEDGEHLAVYVADSSRDAGDELARRLTDDDCTVVVYKGVGDLAAVAEQLREHRRLDGAVVGEMLGLPGGRCAEVDTVADQRASYLATLIVPANRGAS
jgi:precorrin-2/cobalt-factor-2 C20-methyltransferase